METSSLVKMALAGIFATCITAPQLVHAKDEPKKAETEDYNSENVGYELMTKKELFTLLNKKNREKFDKMTPAQQELTLQVASQRCNGTNECKGLNACATDKNECAGKGDCKGKSKCAFSDKNLVIDIVLKRDQMKDKRLNVTKPK